MNKNKENKVTVIVDMRISVTLENFEHNPLCGLSEDQIDDIQMLATDALPQHVEINHNGKMQKAFIEFHEIEEINFYD